MRWALSQFPQAFAPLVVVVGDRREQKPKTSGDLLAYSASPLDLYYLCMLQLPAETPIISDKVFLREREERLKERFRDRNILTIGSPAANHFSRMINEASLIRFEINEQVKQLMRRQEQIVAEYRQNRVALQVYKGLVEHGATTPKEVANQFGIEADDKLEELFAEISERVQSTGLNDYRGMLRSLAGTAILNPIKANHIVLDDPDRRAYNVPPDKDFGFVSLAAHPYSPDKVVVYVAGFHGFGTAYGIKLLAQPSRWKEREYGGIYELNIPPDEWGFRLEGITYGWDMKPKTYDVAGFEVTSLRDQAVVAEASVFISSPLRLNTPHEDRIRALARLIEEKMQKHFPLLRCLHPYEPTTHPWSFVRGVLERSKSALGILHDMTDYAPGVLVEIGYSIGFRKRPVLFWDGSVSRFDPSKLPRVIDRAHIHQVDMSEPSELRALADKAFQALRNERQLSHRPSFPPGCERRALIVVPGRYQRLRESLTRMLPDYNLDPVLEDHLPNEENPARLLNGILAAKYVVVDLTENDPVGLIALGVAAAQKRHVFALHKGAVRPTMLDLPSYSWADDSQLESDLRKWFDGVRASDSVEHGAQS